MHHKSDFATSLVSLRLYNPPTSKEELIRREQNPIYSLSSLIWSHCMGILRICEREFWIVSLCVCLCVCNYRSWNHSKVAPTHLPLQLRANHSLPLSLWLAAICFLSALINPLVSNTVKNCNSNKCNPFKKIHRQVFIFEIPWYTVAGPAQFCWLSVSFGV